MGLWWCFRHEGYGPDVFPTTASTGVNWPGLMQWAQKEGRWVTGMPRRGDVVIFDFSHVGLVTKVHGRRDVTDVEFNTDDSGSRTGGQVMKKRRNTHIVGYFRPDYSAVEKEQGGIADMSYLGGLVVDASSIPTGKLTTLKWSKKGDVGYAMVAGEKEFVNALSFQFAGAASGFLQLFEIAVEAFPGTLRKGSTGAHVKRVQKAVGTHVDGEYGVNTVARVKMWEEKHGLLEDGIISAHNWRVMFPPHIPTGGLYDPVPFTVTDKYPFWTNTVVGYNDRGRHLRARLHLDVGTLRSGSFRVLA